MSGRTWHAGVTDGDVTLQHKMENTNRAIHAIGLVLFVAMVPRGNAWPPSPPARSPSAHFAHIRRLGETWVFRYPPLRAEGEGAGESGGESGGADDSESERVRGIARANVEFDGFEKLRQAQRQR